MKRKIPKSFAPLFWFLDYKKLDPGEDKHLIIHQVLSYGTMDDLRELLKIYGFKTVRNEFKKPKAGLYQPKILAFCQYILGVKKLDKQKYLKNVYAASFRGARSR